MVMMDFTILTEGFLHIKAPGELWTPELFSLETPRRALARWWTIPVPWWKENGGNAATLGKNW